MYASEVAEIHRLKNRLRELLLPTLEPFDGKKPISLLTFLSQLREGLNALGVAEAAAVRVLAFLPRKIGVLLAPDGCGHLSNGPNLQRVCEEPCETTKTYASSTTIFGPTPSRKPLDHIPGPPTKTKKGHWFLLVITDRFTKLTQVIPLRRIDAYTVAVAFVEDWIFKYGPPKTLISDNGKKFEAKFFQAVCSLPGLSNIFRSTYHPQTNGQVEGFNRTILAMLRNYVNEHQNDWDRYATALKYAYNNPVHHSTGTTPFSLVFSRPPPEF